VATDVEGIWNQAFRAAGLPLRVNEAFEGSDGSRVALELYQQCRDELLDLKDWSFNRETAPLVLLKGPPPAGGYNFANPWSNLYPAPGFLYEYSYPSNAVDLRAVIPQPGPMPDLDPRPAVWRVDNDPMPNVSGNPPVAVGPEAKVIYCNVTNALAVYRSRVTNPAIFDPGFTAALVALLGKRFAVAFGADVNKQREDTSEAIATANAQSDVRG
jgi:hypothetical protein